MVSFKKFKKMTRKQLIFWVVVGICFIASMVWVNHNYAFYERPIAKVIQTDVVNAQDVTDQYQNKDRVVTQKIIAEIKNGDHKGEHIHVTNEYSNSKAYDFEYGVGDDLFVFISKHNQEGQALKGSIVDMKRDHKTLIIAWLFVFTLLIVGKRYGLFSIISLAINAAILSYALDLQMNSINISLLWVCAICAILFTMISLLLVNGFNEKTYAAIVATLLGTFISLLITYLVMKFTGEEGLRYEEMEYLTRTYKLVFMAGLFIGSLGAVMDIGITMSSSIFGLYEKNHDISTKLLKKSGMDIGKDIMGAMTNILFFAYISGSIPTLILYLKNGSPLGFTLSMNLSLELARALAGGIGIVISIPIAIYTSIFFVNRKRARL